MRDALADHDIGAVFRFLHQRGWSWASIAQATDIGEQRVREIASGKRRVENYDVYVRVAVGLNIPRDYLGVGLRPADGDGTLTGTGTAPAAPAQLTAVLRTTLELATPANADGGEPPDLGQFGELVMKAWEDRRRNTTLALVAGFAGSGKTEFSAFLSSVTGWALLDKDVLTRPLVESMLAALGGDPNDRQSPLYLSALQDDGQVLYQNHRYGSTYVIDRPHLGAMLDAGQIPVIHLGQVQGIRAVSGYPASWVTAALWCARSTTAHRARARGSADIDARLSAWDETLQDLQQAGDSDFRARLDTDKMEPGDVAKAIDALVMATSRTP